MSPDNYWIQPEDIKTAWFELAKTINGYSNCQLTLTIIVKSGAISYVGEPEIKNLQPRNRNHTESSYQAFAVVRQLQSIGNNIHGAAVLSIDIVLDSLGNPLVWTAPEVRKLRRV